MNPPRSALSNLLDRFGRQHLVVLLLLLAPSMMLVNIQNDATDGLNVPETSWIRSVLSDSYDGTIGDKWHDAVPTIIVKARVLVRELLHAERAVAPSGVSLNFLNRMLQFVFTWAALCILYRTAIALKLPVAWALVAVLSAVAFVPWGFMAVGYGSSFPYDLPALFFSVAGVASIICRRFGWLAVVIAIGTLNKETTLFLIPAYLLAEWPHAAGQRAPLFCRTALLLCLYAVVYEAPRLLLQAGGHPLLITASNAAWDVPRWYLNLQILAGYQVDFTELTYWVVLLHLPALAGFRLLPWSLKALYFAAPLYLGPIFFFGNVNELRLFNEILPLGALGSAIVLAHILDPKACASAPAGTRAP